MVRDVALGKFHAYVGVPCGGGTWGAKSHFDRVAVCMIAI